MSTITLLSQSVPHSLATSVVVSDDPINTSKEEENQFRLLLAFRLCMQLPEDVGRNKVDAHLTLCPHRKALELRCLQVTCGRTLTLREQDFDTEADPSM